MIDVKNLDKSFGENHVLKNLNEHIDQGEKVVIVGPSGSGKSTFLRCLNCMEDPTGGSIIFNGVDIADMSVDINIHRRHMGMVFQHFNLFNNKTVIENIMLAPVHVRCQEMKKAKKQNIEKYNLAVIDTIFNPRKLSKEQVENLRFIPHTNNMEFILEAGLVDKSNVKVPVVECRAPYKAYLDTVEFRQNVINLIDDKVNNFGQYAGLKFGSMEGSNNEAGNWED